MCHLVVKETLLILQENLRALVFFGLLTGSPDRLSRRTPGRTPFLPKQTLFCGITCLRARPLPATPFQCPRSRTATLGKGAAAHFPPLRWPDCTSSRLRAEEYDRPVTQSIATRSRLRGRSPPWIGRWSPARALSVSPHSGADGLVQGELPSTSPEC